MVRRSSRHISVLFVDDEEEVVRSLAKAARLAGYETGETTCPLEAIEMVEERDFDVAVIDLVMPTMGGIDLIRRLLQVDPRLRCVMLTAHGGVDTCDEAYQAGIVRYLEKPITSRRLHDVFTELTEPDPALLPLPALCRLLTPPPPGSSSNATLGTIDPKEVSLTAFRRAAVRRYLLEAARLCEGCPKSMAAMAGVSVPTMYRLAAEYEIPYGRAYGLSTGDGEAD